MKPAFPLTVTYAEGEVATLDSVEDVETHLEWFDSNDPREDAVIHDKYGRRVRLHVEALELLVCELMEQPVDTTSPPTRKMNPD